MLRLNKILKNKSKSNSIAHIIVLVAGVYLSVAFFSLITFSVGVKQSKIEQDRKSNAVSIMQDNFSALKDDFQNLTMMTKKTDLSVLKSKPFQDLANRKFSSAFWIDAKELSLSKKVSSYPLFIQSSKDSLAQEDLNTIKEIYKKFSKKDLELIKAINKNSDSKDILEQKWRGKSNSIALLTLLKLDDGSVGILVGISYAKSIFDSFLMYNSLGLNDIRITQEKKGHELLSASVLSESDFLLSFKKPSLDKYSFIYAGLGEDYRVELSFRETYLSMLLSLIPWAVLCFSFFITFLSSAVLFMNARRAVEMEELNQGLANKNMDLQKEIKKREKMYVSIRQSEQENKAIMNSIDAVVFELDADGHICFINGSWCRITGYDLTDSIGKSLFSYLDEKEALHQTEKIQSLIQGQILPYSVFFRLQTKEGEEKPVEMSISMLRQDRQKNLRIVGTLVDLEEKEKAEQAIKEAEHNYKRIWKNAANGIYEVTLEGQLISANPAMASILGYNSPDQLLREVTNMNEMIYCTPEEKKEAIKSATHEEDNNKFEIQAYKKNREEIWLSEFVQPVINETGEITHLEGTIEDITDRKNADIALKRAKAESDMANRAKSDFLANMSHELRTPLNSIIGFAEVIRDQVMGKIEEPVYKEYAGEIHTSGVGLLSILNQILDVSKIESGDRELNESIVKLSKTSVDTLNLFSEKIREKQLKIINTIDETVEDLIAEDRSVKQMLYNILSNSVKFTPDQGSITLKTSVQDDGALCLSVEDTGEGLTPEHLERALKPFDLMDGEHSREKYGAGLGLTLVKLLMDMHGGHIDMRSEKNVGTVVGLIFPKERVRTVKKDEVSVPVLENDLPHVSGADVFQTENKSIH